MNEMWRGGAFFAVSGQVWWVECDAGCCLCVVWCGWWVLWDGRCSMGCVPQLVLCGSRVVVVAVWRLMLGSGNVVVGVVWWWMW